MNRASIVDTRFDGDGGERLNLDGPARQSFDVEPQQMLHLFERQSAVRGVGVKRVVAARSFERIVTAAGARCPSNSLSSGRVGV